MVSDDMCRTAKNKILLSENWLNYVGDYLLITIMITTKLTIIYKRPCWDEGHFTTDIDWERRTEGD